jgi:hypothetical protein
MRWRWQVTKVLVGVASGDGGGVLVRDGGSVGRRLRGGANPSWVTELGFAGGALLGRGRSDGGVVEWLYRSVVPVNVDLVGDLVVGLT